MNQMWKIALPCVSKYNSIQTIYGQTNHMLSTRFRKKSTHSCWQIFLLINLQLTEFYNDWLRVLALLFQNVPRTTWPLYNSLHSPILAYGKCQLIIQEQLTIFKLKLIYRGIRIDRISRFNQSSAGQAFTVRSVLSPSRHRSQLH